MTFPQLIEQLQNPPKDNPHYYDLIISNPKVILLEVALTSKTEVATALNMSLPKLSIILPLLKALARLDNVDD